METMVQGKEIIGDKVLSLVLDHIIDVIESHIKDYEILAQKVLLRAEAIERGSIFSEEMDPIKDEVARCLREVGLMYLNKARFREESSHQRQEATERTDEVQKPGDSSL